MSPYNMDYVVRHLLITLILTTPICSLIAAVILDQHSLSAMLHMTSKLWRKLVENCRYITPPYLGVPTDPTVTVPIFRALFMEVFLKDRYGGKIFRNFSLLLYDQIRTCKGDSAENQAAFITDVLELFGRRRDDVWFLVADNTSVNPATARLLGCSFIGCASHRFNLAVKEYMLTYEEKLDDIQSLMKKLLNLHQKCARRSKTLRFHSQ